MFQGDFSYIVFMICLSYIVIIITTLLLIIIMSLIIMIIIIIHISIKFTFQADWEKAIVKCVKCEIRFL